MQEVTVKSGNEEFTLEVTEEEYRNYYRPWWQQKKLLLGVLADAMDFLLPEERELTIFGRA